MLAKSSKTCAGLGAAPFGDEGLGSGGFASLLGGFACAMGLLLGLLFF
jgi:hypothetical protein